MRFLLDHNVPANVGAFLRQREHDVVVVMDILAQDAPDPLVAKAAMAEERVLVSHDRDMRRVERLISEGFRARYPALSRMHLSCPEVASAERVESFIEVIEAEFACLLGRGLPMLLEIGERRARLIR